MRHTWGMINYTWEWTREKEGHLRWVIRNDICADRDVARKVDSRAKRVMKAWCEFVDELTRYQCAGTEVYLDFNNVFVVEMCFLSRLLPQACSQLEDVTVVIKTLTYRDFLDARDIRNVRDVRQLARYVVAELFVGAVEQFSKRPVVEREYRDVRP